MKNHSRFHAEKLSDFFFKSKDAVCKDAGLHCSTILGYPVCG